jgi:hypothetical protein
MNPRRRAARAALLILLPFLGVSAVRADDAPDATRSGGLLRASWGYPSQATLGFGVVVTKMPANYDCKTTCYYRGATIQGSAGTGAGELAIGYGSLVGETTRGDWLLRHVYVGYGVRLAVLRTWGSSTLEPQGATFWGVEGAFTIGQFSMTMGAFRPMAPDGSDHQWRIFGGAGWGF